MISKKAPRFLWYAIAVALVCPTCLIQGRPLTIAGNIAGSSYEPASGVIYSEMRSRLTEDFPGTTFVTLAALTGNLSGFDLLVLNRFASQALTLAEQTNLHSYVLNGGNLLYVGEDTGLSNDSFTNPFGIAMAPDPTTDIAIAFATYTNLGSPFLTGPFGAPSNPPSGSDAAKIITLGPSVELARWNGGGTAISAFGPNTLSAGAGFGVFVTDANMMTPARYSLELGDVLSNALLLPEPSSLACLLLGAAGCFGRRRFFRAFRA